MGKQLGLDLWIKRDDLTGFAGGGNKGRKLEYIIAEILDSGSGRVVTCGSKQSNFVRQIGAACSVHGIKCTAVVMALPYDQEVGKPEGDPPCEGGNVVLDDLFGVELLEVADGDWLDLYAEVDRVADVFRSAGESVTVVPVGGSTPLGAYSFVQAAVEVGEGWDSIVLPTSSGSSHAGLAWAFHGSRTNVIGISCDPEEDLQDDLKRLTDGIDGIAGFAKHMSREDFHLRREWFGAGYNIPSENGTRAAITAARMEGLVLDPVYTAKAFAGLLSLANAGELKGRVLFWHTGGLPTVFARP